MSTKKSGSPGTYQSNAQTPPPLPRDDIVPSVALPGPTDWLNLSAADHEVRRGAEALVAESFDAEGTVRRVLPVRLYIDSPDAKRDGATARRALEDFCRSFDWHVIFGVRERYHSFFKELWVQTFKAINKKEFQDELQIAHYYLEMLTLGKLQADIDEKQGATIRELLKSLESVERAVIQVGAILVAKFTKEDRGSCVVIRTLTPDEMIALRDNSVILTSPETILQDLEEWQRQRAKQPPAGLAKALAAEKSATL